MNSISQQATQNNNANGEILISSSTSNNSKQSQPIQPRRSTRNKDYFHLIIDETLKNNINSSTLEISQDTTRQAHKKNEVITPEIPQGASIDVAPEINSQGSNITKRGRKKKTNS